MINGRSSCGWRWRRERTGRSSAGGSGSAAVNGYKWLRRYLSEGRAGLAERSRRPLAARVERPAPWKRRSCGFARTHQAWGGRKIARCCSDAGESAAPWRAITEILRRHGRLEERGAEHPGPFRRFEQSQPNELWQMDFKGHFEPGAGAAIR